MRREASKQTRQAPEPAPNVLYRKIYNGDVGNGIDCQEKRLISHQFLFLKLNLFSFT